MVLSVGGCQTPTAVVLLTPEGNARLQYESGSEGAGRLLLLRRGERLFTEEGATRTLHTRGHPLFDAVLDPDTKEVRAFMVHIRDVEGRVAFTLLDENADGEFDKKVDYQTQAVYEWKSGRWIGLKPQPTP